MPSSMFLITWGAEAHVSRWSTYGHGFSSCVKLLMVVGGTPARVTNQGAAVCSKCHWTASFGTIVFESSVIRASDDQANYFQGIPMQAGLVSTKSESESSMFLFFLISFTSFWIRLFWNKSFLRFAASLSISVFPFHPCVIAAAPQSS